MSIRPDLIEPLSIEIARVFTIEDLQQVVLTTTGKGLFQYWVGEGKTVKDTAFQLLQRINAEGNHRSVLTEMLARRPTDEALTYSIRLACPDARHEVTKDLRSARSIEISRLPSTQVDLIGRDAEIELLRKAWKDPSIRIVSIVALGGLGKSALVNKWLVEMAGQEYQKARVFGWSFYAQGTKNDFSTSSEFIQEALTWFGDPDPLRGDEYEKGRRLASLVRTTPTIFLLDGLEPLQSPPGPNGGAISDPAIKSLLTSLASSNSGLCVVTTRYHIADLERFGEGVSEIEVSRLSPDDGVTFLRSLGVKGEDAAIEDAVAEYGGHPLALRLLGTFLTTVHRGDIEKRSSIPLREWDDAQGGKARRIMDSYARWFGDGPALQLLRILGLFDRPADPESLAALRRPPFVVSLTDKISNDLVWATELQRLRGAGLISNETSERPGEIDTHPLIRDFFGAELHSKSPEAWRAGHSRLFEHLRDSTPALPDRLADMFRLFLAISHGCKAGRHTEALRSIYIKRVQRGRTTYYSTKKFGIPTHHLAALMGFSTDDPLVFPQELGVIDRIYILMEKAYELRAIGRLKETAPVLLAARDEGLRSGRYRDCAAATDNLSEVYSHLGDMNKSIMFARQSVDFAHKSGGGFEIMFSNCTLANALHLSGNLIEAEKYFVISEKYQALRQPSDPRLKSLNGAQYCDYLISVGRIGEAASRARDIVERLGQIDDTRIARAISSVVLARALLLSEDASVNEARSLLKHAVATLRDTGQRQELALAMVAFAALASRKQATMANEIAENIREATDIANESESILIQIEVNDAWANIYEISGERELAEHHAAEAQRLRNKSGYRRMTLCGSSRSGGRMQ